MKLFYSVEKMAYASHLKSSITSFIEGRIVLRELAVPEAKIRFENPFEPQKQEFELEYVDGKQIKVGLVNDISFDTTQTSGEFTLEFETLELPYFESIAYNTILEKKMVIWINGVYPTTIHLMFRIRKDVQLSMIVKQVLYIMVVLLKSNNLTKIALLN